MLVRYTNLESGKMIEATDCIRGPLEQLVARLVDAGVTGEVRIDLEAGERLTDAEGVESVDEAAIVADAVGRLRSGPVMRTASVPYARQ